MKQKLISIIVPVYKVEKYLSKCIDSIINQTYKNLEIILVDDGSPDNCPKICDGYAKKDKRIKIIHKENGGLSSARNAGLDIMTGEFVAFLDSDDYIEPTYIEIMAEKQVKYNADLVNCGVKDIIENTGEEIIKVSVKEDVVLENEEIIKQFFSTYNLTVAWNKLYRKEIFATLRYPQGRIFEDAAIILNVLSKCKKLVIIPDVLYNYLKREGSIMNCNISEKKINSLIENFIDRTEFLIENNYKQFLSQEVSTQARDFGFLYRTCKNKVIKKQIKSKFLPLWKKYKKYAKLNSKASIKMLLNVGYIKLF